MMQNAKSSILSFLFFSLFAIPLFSQPADSLILCSGGNGQTLSSNAPNGVFYDPGGPFNYYGNGEYCELLIDPGCAESITISVHEYNTESCCDWLRFYDGVDGNAPLSLDMQYLGAPQSVTLYSGKVFIRWYTDGSVVGTGFRVTWVSELVASDPPVANFTFSEANPALQELVQFDATATNFPYLWEWDFGDGNTGLGQNPSHAYNVPGQYTVRLIATNCYGLTDTVEQLIEVQQAPLVSVDPTQVEATLDCGSTSEAFVQIINSGAGELHVQFNGGGVSDKVRPLVYNYLAFYYSVDGIANELSLYSSEYDLQFSAATDSATFAAELASTDVLIFPDIPPSFESFTVLNILRGAILDFVAAGGSIIFCGQEYGGNVLSFTGLLSSDFSNYYISNSYIDLPIPHPITAGLPSGIYTLYASMGLNFTNPDYVNLASINGYSWLGYREVGRSKVIYLGSNFNAHDWTQGLLMHNALQWCGSRGNVTVNPSEAEIAPGDTLQVAVQISAANLFAGDYYGTLNFSTNDPLQPNLTMPYTLHVLGSADLLPSPDALDFGALQQFSQSAQSVEISNPGCDTLFVQSVASSSAAYTVNPQQLEVLPFSSNFVTVTFFPQDTGWQAAHLVLQSNIGIDSLPLAGYSVGAPIIGVNPQSLTATVSCGDSTTLPLTITNTGLGDLEVNVSGIGGNPGQVPLKILMMYAGTYSSYVFERTEAAILTRFPNAQLTRFDVQDINELPSLLADKNLVVVPFVGYGDQFYFQQLGQALQPFVQSGGGLIFTGTFVYESLNAYGFLDCPGDIINAYSYGMTAIQPQHPILQGLNLQAGIFDDFFGAIFSNPDFEPLANVTSFPHTAVGVRALGAGKVVYLAPVFANHSPTELGLLENAVKWCARPTWLAASPTSVSIPVGGSVTIQVQFNASGFVENTYSGNLLLLTNDPQNPEMNVPCTMVVEGEPELENLQSNLNFGVLQQFDKKDIVINFENTGCDTLNVLSATTDNPVFQVLNFDAGTLPGGIGDVGIRFAPLLPGNLSATLTLVTDDGTFTVALAGLAIGAPIGAVNPGSLSVDLACDESTTVSVTLSNSGLGSMSYQVGNLQSPRKVLAMTYGVSIFRWSNFRNYLLSNVPNVSLSEYGGSIASRLADSIAQKGIDVLIVPTLDYSSDPVYFAFAPIIQSFLQNGGQVLCLGAYYPYPLEQMGLFELIGTEGYSISTVRVGDKAHRMTAGLPDTYQQNDACYFGTFPFGEVRSLMFGPNDNNVFLGFRNVGQGNVVYWAQIFDSPDATSVQLMKNVFAWFSNPVPSGVEVPTISGMVPIGGSVSVQVSFSGQNLPGGQYQGQVRLYTNDPVNNPLVIPVTLNMDFKPCTNFGFVTPPCSGTLSFKDSTLNTASSWYWDFGDGATSFAQNPTHTYASENIYNVTLVSCNNFGCDTLSRPVEVLSIDGPKLANCNPQTFSSCCDAGIRRVQIGFLNNPSDNAFIEGYQDFSCDKGTELMAGIQFPITVTTGNQNWEYVRGWIDLNNNGVFSDNEQIINDQAFISHHGFFTPPINAVKDVPLRMRIMSEPTFQNPILTPCSNLQYGQCEDYYVVIKTTVGTTEPVEEMSVRVYPNPSADEAWIEFSLPEAQSVTLKIADQMGRIVWENNVENVAAGITRLPLPELPAGAYAVAVQSGETMKVEKFIRVDRP